MHRAILLLLLLPALAGCVTPDDGGDTDPLLGVCPQWVEGDWTEDVRADLSGDASDSQTLAPPLEQDGRPVDLYRFTFHNASIDGGPLELRAYADDADRRLGILDYREPDGPRLLPVLTLGPDSDVVDQEFQVILASLEHGSMPAADALRLDWTLEGGSASLELHVTAHYRVCGAVSP